MANVLLVDTNFSATPIYDFLVANGHDVFVVGGNPTDSLAKSAARYVSQDYSDIASIRILFNKLKIDFLVPGCNDLSYLVCAALNDQGRFFGFDKLDIAETLHHKHKFRDFAFSLRLPCPHILGADEVGKRWPIIVKPVDAFSGRGVTVLRADQAEKLESAMQLATQYSRTRSYLIEDYVEGQLYSHSAFLGEQQIVCDVIVEEHGTANPFVVDTSRVLPTPSPTILQAIRESIATLARSLNLNNGLIHTQFIQCGDDISIIEVTRRCPGDLYSQLIQLSTGINYVENYVRPFLGMPYRFVQSFDNPAWIMRHTISSPIPFSFKGLRYVVPLHVEKFVPLCVTGDRLQASPFGRVAILFARASDQEQMDTLFQLTLDRNLYTFET